MKAARTRDDTGPAPTPPPPSLRRRRRAGLRIAVGLAVVALVAFAGTRAFGRPALVRIVTPTPPEAAAAERPEQLYVLMPRVDGVDSAPSLSAQALFDDLRTRLPEPQGLTPVYLPWADSPAGLIDRVETLGMPADAAIVLEVSVRVRADMALVTAFLTTHPTGGSRGSLRLELPLTSRIDPLIDLPRWIADEVAAWASESILP